MHYAVCGHTAAELIAQRADHTKERMGLTTWAKAPGGKILKSDVVVAKNYLTEEELADLGRISAEIAREQAESEFDKIRVIQDRLFKSDFDTFAALEKCEDDKTDE